MTYNNTQYNSIEPDICHLVYIAKVESMKDTEVYIYCSVCVYINSI